MAYARLYIFVEGEDDLRFLDRIMKRILLKKFDYVEFIRYAEELPRKVSAYIRSIKCMMDATYIFTGDLDSKGSISEAKNYLQNKYKGLDVDNIIIVVKEIEAWYLAGLDENGCKNLGINYLDNTDAISKEDFDRMIPRKSKYRIDFMLEILKNYSISLGTKRNRSFLYLYNKVIA